MTTLPIEADPQDDTSRPDFLGPDLSPDEHAPYGYMIDPVSGGRRPKKKPGRPRDASRPPVPDGGLTPPGPPSIEDLKAIKAPRAAAQPDRPPGAVKDRRGKFKAPKPPVDVPPFRAGPIAKGVNRIYYKTGKIIALGDRDVGNAVIACTRKSLIRAEDGTLVPDPDDVTVGEAWEELARTNPRIRAFLLTTISCGALMTLVMAHAPILLAVLMKDGIRQRIPFGRLIGALLAEDGQDDDDYDFDGYDDEPGDPGGNEFAAVSSILGALTPDDMAQMQGLFTGMMSNMAGRMPPGTARAPVVDGLEPEQQESPP